MNLLQLRVKNFGPITNAGINFADLTILTGSNGCGKGLLLQLIKLIVDKDHFAKTIQQYGYVWEKNTSSILDHYFREGMAGIWSSKTQIELDAKHYPKDFLLQDKHAPRTDDEGVSH